MSPDAAKMPALSPARPALATQSRISASRSPSSALVSPARPDSPGASDELEGSLASLPVMSPALSLVSEMPAIDDDVFAHSTGALESGAARELLKEQLKRNDSIRLGKKASGKLSSPDRSDLRSRPVTPAVDGSPMASSSKMTLDDEPRHPRRRYYILSSAGKPVFCSDEEDSESHSSQVGVMQAIVSIFADEGSNLRTIVANNLRISFLLKAPLYYVAVSDWAEADSVLRMHLEYLHLHVVSVTSATQLQKIFHQHKNFDLRRLLAGTEAQLHSLVARLQSDLAVIMNALHVYKIDPGIRDKVANALLPPKEEESAFYAILLVEGQIVTLLRPKKHSVHPSDLHLLVNTVLSSPSLLRPEAEAWIPICLPRFNSSGFLHALVTYITERVGLILLSNDREAFFSVREWKEAAVAKLRKQSLIEPLEAEQVNQSISLGALGIAGLRHFLYKSRPYVQVVWPEWEGLYSDAHQQERLILAYHSVADQLHRKQPVTASGRQPAKLVYLRSEHEAVLGWASQAFELYLALSPMLPKGAAVAAAHSVLRWIRQHEAKLFLSNAPVF